ncbi:MAG: hypothetical protein IPM80_17020 [Proteobacteria bacterium]|nr:hypothetical protein [Pseudomonadota bacterium]MBK8960061.1 hypothetical protein [Pseudomonadota bacterium]
MRRATANLINHGSWSAVPDQKCLTDNIDRFDTLVFSGSLGPSPYAALVNTMIDMAIETSPTALTAPSCIQIVAPMSMAGLAVSN